LLGPCNGQALNSEGNNIKSYESQESNKHCYFTLKKKDEKKNGHAKSSVNSSIKYGKQMIFMFKVSTNW